MSASRTYLVVGMTCGHCEHAVTTAVSAVPGVHFANAELASGRLLVVGDVAINEIAAAVRTAGYEIREGEADR